MLALITGGSGSGKSDYAEQLARGLYTSARMGGAADLLPREAGYPELKQPEHKGRERKHPEQEHLESKRPALGRGYTGWNQSGQPVPEGRLLYLATMRNTGEDPEVVDRIARHRERRAGGGFETIERERRVGDLPYSGRDTILLEDLTNLLANEWYSPGGEKRGPDEIAGELEAVSAAGNTLVIVTNEITSDIPPGWEETRHFMKMLMELNVRIARQADFAAEVWAGIPLILKRGDRWPAG